jgi:hypothetical protein
MKTRLPVSVRRARSRTAEFWRAGVCFATLCGACVLGVTPVHAWVGAQGGSSTVASRLSAAAPVPPPHAPTPSSTPTPSAAEVDLQLSDLTRVLPQDPNPVQLQLPAELTQEQLRGGYGFALALSLFSGLLLTATLVLLFGLSAHRRWFAAERSSSPASRRSSPSHR